MLLNLKLLQPVCCAPPRCLYAASTMSSQDGSSANPIASGSRSAAPDLPALQAASHLIHEQLTKDAQTIPDLGDMLTIRRLRLLAIHLIPLTATIFSGRAILGFLHCVSWRLPCPFSKAKTYRHPANLMGTLSVCVFVKKIEKISYISLTTM